MEEKKALEDELATTKRHMLQYKTQIKYIVDRELALKPRTDDV